MLYLLDTANLPAITRLIDIYPVAGVTTNPTIVAREGRPFRDLLISLRKAIGPDRQLHVQVVAPDAAGMLAEARLLQELVGGESYAKVPITPEGLKAMRLMHAEGLPVTATAVFTVQQAMLAARAGASFVAPYVNRLDQIQSSGADLVARIVKSYKEHGIATRVLAASFRNCEQVERCCEAGVHAVTVSPDILEQLLNHPLTDSAVARFAEDWKQAYGGQSIDELLR